VSDGDQDNKEGNHKDAENHQPNRGLICVVAMSHSSHGTTGRIRRSGEHSIRPKTIAALLW